MSIPILRRDELLDFVRLTELLKDLPEEQRIPIIAELRTQAKREDILRDFGNQIKLVTDKLKRAVVPTTQIETITGLPECIINLGNEYLFNEDGIYLQLGANLIEVCPHPIFPIEILKDLNTGDEKVRISFKRYGKWNSEIIVERYDLATTKNIVKLANTGIMVNDENARYLIKYFADIEKLNEYYIPQKKTVNKLGWTEYGFVPYVNDIVYSGNSSTNARIFSMFTEKGDFEVWKKLQTKVCKHKIPKLMIAAGYASLLTEKFGLNPFCVHLWGETGRGKSVSVVASASIYGYPDIKNGIVRTGNTTSNGIEPILGFFNNCTTYFDELTTLSPQQIQDLVYAFSGGQGRGRMSKNGSSQFSYTWNNIAVFNAECPLINSKSKGGAVNRVISIYTGGNVFGDMDLPYVANTFKENYGFGAKRFIEIMQQPGMIELIKKLRKIYYDDLIKHTEDKQANAMSVLLTAYEIARVYIYENEETLSAEDVREFLATQEEISQVRRTYKLFLDYVEANYRYFDESEINQNKWGCITKNGREINIFPTCFDDFCIKNNIDSQQFLLGLRDAQLLQTRPQALKNRVNFNGKTVTMISVIKRESLNELEKTEEFEQEIIPI